MAEQATGPDKVAKIDDVVDLNPTAFVDDVYNAVRALLLLFRRFCRMACP